ncbi:MAG: DMT family transporter [Oscillospiraceae bacterium]|nr:DMT family transporter [Oscillospiraceae bacterium]
MEKNRPIAGRLALFATTLFWGSSFVVLKNALDALGILWILAVRFSVAALLLALFANKRLRGMDPRSLRGSVLIGVCLASAYIVQTYGLKYTTPGKNAFLTATYCVLTPFLAWLLYRRRPAPSNVLAAFLCITGIGFVSLGGETATLNFGDALTLCCGVFYALQILLIERYVSGCDALCISTIEFATAALICWCGTLLFEKAPAQITPSLWGSIAYMSIVCTGLCFFLQAWGIRYTPANTAAVILTFEAVFGALSSILFYHERMTVKLVLGFALIFLSVLISEAGASLWKRDMKP